VHVRACAELTHLAQRVYDAVMNEVLRYAETEFENEGLDRALADDLRTVQARAAWASCSWAGA
jgi:hypothetical protein